MPCGMSKNKLTLGALALAFIALVIGFLTLLVLSE